MPLLKETLNWFCEEIALQNIPKIIYLERKNQAWHERKNQALKLIIRRKKRLEKKLLEAEKALLQANAQIPLSQNYATLLQAHFNAITKKSSSILLPSFDDESLLLKIPLDPMLTAAQNITAYYKKAKKAESSLPHLRNLIELTSSNLLKTEADIHGLESLIYPDPIPLEDELKRHPHLHAAPKDKKITLPYREFISKDGYLIRVGKSAKDNDSLTFTYSNGLDHWLHVANYSGSHVVIKNKREKELPAATLQDAMQLALHFSQARTAKEAEVHWTQIKHLKRVKGKIGAVQIASSKQKWVATDPQILKRLFADNRQSS